MLETANAVRVSMPTSSSPLVVPAEEQVFIENVINNRRGRPGALLGILEAAQERNRYKYLPLDTLRYIASKMDLPLSRIYSVATFYALFNLQPQAKHDLHLPRHRVPHARISKPAAGRSLELGLGLDADDTQGNEADKLLLTTPDRSSRCAPWRASDSAPWLQWSRSTIAYADTPRNAPCNARFRPFEQESRNASNPGYWRFQRGPGSRTIKARSAVPRVAIGMGTCGRGMGRRPVPGHDASHRGQRP